MTDEASVTANHELRCDCGQVVVIPKMSPDEECPYVLIHGDASGPQPHELRWVEVSEAA